MRCVDLFAGCGGLSLGFQNAGFFIVAAFDNWDAAVEIYKQNFNHPVINQDLTNEIQAIQRIAEFNPDLIMGGPPCQDFSSAGKRNIALGRADLTYHFANIVCAISPKWFVMENVPQIRKNYIIGEIVEQFIGSGYGLSSVILNASFCGVPQTRTRFFLIGHKDDGHNRLNNIMRVMLSDKAMTVRDYLGTSLGIDYYYRHPRNYNRRGIFSIDEPSPTVRGVNRPIPSGYKLNNCDPKSVSLDDIRPLTTIERSYIQTFPRGFNFPGVKTNLEQIIGNAVPVNLGNFVAKAIQNYEKGDVPSMSLFEEDESFLIPNGTLSKLRRSVIG